MGKDGIVLLIAIKKRPIFRRQRDCEIQDDIDGNSLGNRCCATRQFMVVVPRLFSAEFEHIFSDLSGFDTKCVHDRVHEHFLRPPTSAKMRHKSLILLVGAQGLEPWTR
jgi:hypothetical protein